MLLEFLNMLNLLKLLVSRRGLGVYLNALPVAGPNEDIGVTDDLEPVESLL